MSENIKFKCDCCGKIHDEWPALTFNSPDNYNCLSENDKNSIGYLDKDFCVINYQDQSDRFIRCVLEVVGDNKKSETKNNKWWQVWK